VNGILENAMLLFSGHMDTDIISLVHYAHHISFYLYTYLQDASCMMEYVVKQII